MKPNEGLNINRVPLYRYKGFIAPLPKRPPKQCTSSNLGQESLLLPKQQMEKELLSHLPVISMSSNLKVTHLKEKPKQTKKVD